MQWVGNLWLAHTLLSFLSCKKRTPAHSQEAHEDRHLSVGVEDILSEALSFAGRWIGAGGFQLQLIRCSFCC